MKIERVSSEVRNTRTERSQSAGRERYDGWSEQPSKRNPYEKNWEARVKMWQAGNEAMKKGTPRT